MASSAQGTGLVIALDAIVSALALQPGIDAKKLTADINACLLQWQVSAEDHPQQATLNEAVKTARNMLSRNLPDLPKAG